MKITVNGETREVEADLSVTALLELLRTGTGACAVEVNRVIVPRRRHSECKLTEGDQIEIVTLVGGG